MAGLGLLNRRRAIASSPTAGKSAEDLLEDLLFRWSIKGQGATNESLAANPKLKDLTGNGFDLTLKNFTFDGSTNGIMTDEDGEPFLRFASSPACYAQGNFSSLGFAMADIPDYTLIVKREWVSEGVYEYLLRIYGGNSNYQVLYFENNDTKAKKYSKSRGFKDLSGAYITNVYRQEKSVVYQVTDSYNGLIPLPLEYSTNYNNVNSIQIGNTGNKGIFHIYDVLFFRKKLTEKEIASIVRYFEL